MTAARMPLLRAKFFVSGTNAPLVDGQVTTAESGTDTPLETWSDFDQDNLNTNPIILDANGEADIYGGPQAYRITVRDSDGNLVMPIQDNVYFNGSSNAISSQVDTIDDLRQLPFGTIQFVEVLGYNSATDGCGGQFIWNPDSDRADDGVLVFSPDSVPMTGRWIRQFTGPISVKYAGNTGDGLSDTSNTIFNILNADSDSDVPRGTSIYFPFGVYKFLNDIIIPTENIVVRDGNAIFKVATTKDVEINGPIQSPATNWFVRETDFLGSAFTQNKESFVYPEWFGAVGDDSTDDITAFQKAFEANGFLYIFPSLNNYAVSSDPGFPSGYIIFSNSSVHNGGAIYFTPGINSNADINLQGGANLTCNEVHAENVVANSGVIGAIGIFSGKVTAKSSELTAGNSGQDYLVGGQLPGFTGSINNSGSSPTTLFSSTFAGTTLLNSGDRIKFECRGVSTTSNPTLSIKFAGNELIISAALSSATRRWSFCGEIIFAANANSAKVVYIQKESNPSDGLTGVFCEDIQNISLSAGGFNDSQTFVIVGTGVSSSQVSLEEVHFEYWRTLS